MPPPRLTVLFCFINVIIAQKTFKKIILATGVRHTKARPSPIPRRVVTEIKNRTVNILVLVEFG